jgi:hypothetical protein
MNLHVDPIYLSPTMQYRSFAGTKSRHVNEQFIELFDLDLVTLPYNLPTWLVEQQKMLVRFLFVFLYVHISFLSNYDV